MAKRIELTDKQYSDLVSLLQKKSLEMVSWIASLEAVQRDEEYQAVAEILKAVREAEEVKE